MVEKLTNTRAASRLLSTSMSPEFNVFQLPVLEYFSGKPFHAYSIHRDCDLPRLRSDLADSLIRSEIIRSLSASGKEDEHARQLLFQLADGVFCHIDSFHVTIYAAHADSALEHADRLWAKYGITGRRDGPHFFLFTTRTGVLDIQAVKITKPFVLGNEDLTLHYTDKITNFEGKLIEAFGSRAAGVTILRGEPGTGKTSFVRHLVAKLQKTHRFYYLPAHCYHYLTAPEMVEFWLRQRRMFPKSTNIIIIEDAEDLLMERASDNRAKVSDLLNIADGFLGEFLQVHLICTVNSRLERLDPAIMRPGRLVGFHEFKRLTREQAARLAEAKGLKLAGEQSEYSLAEIYLAGSAAARAFSRRVIGFVG